MYSFDDFFVFLVDYEKLYVKEKFYKCYYCDEIFIIVIICKEYKIMEIIYCYNLCYLIVLIVSLVFE